ncbi:Protein of unknown function [Devosia enhydra]|uniref:Mu-like prophage protein gp16 n=1 Tax=Devosia enhydra TaxID=665118 RepID=A0A1K2I2J8_9HYPH|nr:regulatory protein GemA [Devosia enhydra]SFZ85980.1 Protein of unknown function [Devosia enhydra]
MTALKAIHALARQLGMDEETRRAFSEREVGQRSLRAMSPSQQHQLVVAMKRAAGQDNSRTTALAGPYAKKLQALWIAGWNLGIVQNREDKALLAFVKRQSGVDHTRFLLEADKAEAAIGALEAWIAREAGVVWRKGKGRDVQDCVIEAQVRILGLKTADPDPSNVCLQAYDAWRAGSLDRASKQRAMNLLGQNIRAAR